MLNGAGENSRLPEQLLHGLLQEELADLGRGLSKVQVARG